MPRVGLVAVPGELALRSGTGARGSESDSSQPRPRMIAGRPGRAGPISIRSVLDWWIGAVWGFRVAPRGLQLSRCVAPKLKLVRPVGAGPGGSRMGIHSLIGSAAATRFCAGPADGAGRYRGFRSPSSSSAVSRWLGAGLNRWSETRTSGIKTPCSRTVRAAGQPERLSRHRQGRHSRTCVTFRCGGGVERKLLSDRR